VAGVASSSEERLNNSIKLSVDLRSLRPPEKRRNREPDSQRQAGDDYREEHISSCETFSHGNPLTLALELIGSAARL